MAALRHCDPTLSEDQIEQMVVMSSAGWLQVFDDTKGKRCFAVLNEIRRWYFMTSKDLALFASASEDARGDINRFLDDFRVRFGYSFHSVSGVVQDVVDRAARRGFIASPEEYEILREIEVAGHDNNSECIALIRAYEDKQE
ncbi:hypothetical protein ACFO5X_08200 [Seohaeicola nanhaiensis]|uniref:Uncharacterized protein n=1 Tax=Seohaeicola nanhaiensis TaxID=1387282 RepID=A0ABV9KF06_9RHOB